MKNTLKKTLALALALVMCISLLPISALAAAGGGATPANPPTVTIEGTPMLIKGDYQHEAGDKTPFLSVSWNYGDFSLPDGEVYGATVYAWAGTETTRPSSYWKKDIDATGNGGSFSGKLVSVGNPDQIYSNCMVRVSFSYNGSTYSDTKQGVATVQGGSGYTAPVSVTISGTPTLSGSSSPSLSVGWNYGKNLTGDYSGMIYAWKDDGNNGALPQDCWYQEFTDGNGGTSDSTTVALAKMSDSTATLEGDCWVQVSLSLSSQATVSSAPVSVSFGSSSSGGGGTNEHLPVPSTSLPVIEAVTYYDKDYSYLVDYSDTYHGYPAVWYMYTEGSNDLEVFALLPADSESAATSASVSGYSGFQSDGQWYSVAGFWTVNPSTDLTDKDGTHRTLMTPLYCGDGSVPAQGTTLYLSLWDYENSGMSNLVPVTVPGTGQTASATDVAEPRPTVTISGTPTLTGGDSPTLSVSWSYSSALPNSDVYYVRSYVWPGTSTTRPSTNYWLKVTGSSSDNYFSKDSDTSASLVAAPLAEYGSATLSGACMVELEFQATDGTVLASVAPVQVTATESASGGGGGNEHLPTPSTLLPVISEVTYYDKDYSYLLAYPDTYHGYPAVWYMYTEGSNNLEVFALLPAASEEAAASASLSGYSGFQSDGQWYSVAGLWTVNPSTDLMDKDGTTRTLMTPLYCGDSRVPAQGTTLYLCLWDYDNRGLSNLVPVTVPGTGQTASATGVAEPRPTITISSLENGSVLSGYSATLTGTTVNGGALSWSATGLPGGLTCSSAGVISGTPTESGTFTVTVTLTEAGVEKTASRTLSLTVSSGSPTVTTTSLPDATWGLAYTATLAGTATKGGALSWTLDEGSDALPSGITLAENGTLSGTAAQGTEGDYSLKFKLSEAGNDKTGAATLTFKVKAPAGPSITINANLPKAKAKLSYSLPLTGSASELGGTLSWSLAEGSSLPEGLSLAADGTLSGTPAEAAIQSEAYSFTVKLTETKGAFTLTATKTLYLTVAEPEYYNVYFYLNGGTAAAGSEGDYADRTHVLETPQITLPAAPTKTGYDFEAWYTGGELYQPGATVTLTRNLYIYARWKEKAPTAVVYTGPQLLGNAYLPYALYAADGDRGL